MSKLQGYSNIVECPYNKAHQIESGRLQRHLSKCRKEYEKNHPPKLECPYNSTHLLDDEKKLKKHMQDCPSKIQWEYGRFSKPTINSTKSSHQGNHTNNFIQEIPSNDDEDWDKEPTTPAYDPQKYCESNNIVRTCPSGMQRHERKAFRHQEYMRLRQFTP